LAVQEQHPSKRLRLIYGQFVAELHFDRLIHVLDATDHFRDDMNRDAPLGLADRNGDP
jgi:hypothetical protein